MKEAPNKNRKAEGPKSEGNPKAEGRSPKEGRNPKSESTSCISRLDTKATPWPTLAESQLPASAAIPFLRISDFSLLSAFGGPSAFL